MKKIIGLLVLSVLLVGCEMFLEPSPYDVIRDPTIHFTSLGELKVFVVKAIAYESSGTYYKAPQETIDDGTADCMDYAILVGYFAERDLGMTVRIEGVKTYKPNVNHALVYLNGVPYEPQLVCVAYRSEYAETIEWFTMEEALTIAVQCGSRTISGRVEY